MERGSAGSRWKWYDKQKSVQVIVPKKFMIAEEGKDLTIEIKQILFIGYLKTSSYSKEVTNLKVKDKDA